MGVIPQVMKFVVGGGGAFTDPIPMSLVPITSLGNRYGVSVRGMESIIRLACIAHRTDYWQRGRTLERLGLEHLSVSELTRYVTGKSKHQMLLKIFKYMIYNSF